MRYAQKKRRQHRDQFRPTSRCDLVANDFAQVGEDEAAFFDALGHGSEIVFDEDNGSWGDWQIRSRHHHHYRTTISSRRKQQEERKKKKKKKKKVRNIRLGLA